MRNLSAMADQICISCSASLTRGPADRGCDVIELHKPRRLGFKGSRRSPSSWRHVSKTLTSNNQLRDGFSPEKGNGMEPRFRRGIAFSRRPYAPRPSRPSKALHALVEGFFFTRATKTRLLVELNYHFGVSPLEVLFTYSPSQLRAALLNPAGRPSLLPRCRLTNISREARTGSWPVH